MSYIAYKTAQNDPNLPNGFITEHFQTDKDTLEGYNVVTLEIFNALFQNNAVLVRKAEAARGIVTQNPNTPPPVPRSVSEVEHVPPDFVPPAPAAPTTPEATAANAELFNQFLAWVAANKPGSSPSNT